jgi:threonine dehydrogenase-like Zn-dependent dehydrogenase
MACVWAFKKGARLVIGIDNNWRTEFAKSRIPGLTTINYEALGKQSIPAKIHEIVPGGVDACIEASGGEYAKTWKHKLQMIAGAEQDTSEIINECIYSVRKFGRVGIIADYVGCRLFPFRYAPMAHSTQSPITSTSEQLWSVVSDL